MPELKVVEGRKSTLYNHFEEYELSSCRATASRLMGAVAMKISWRSIDDPGMRYHQILHLDYSEYGIDEYLEFECTPGSDDYADIKQNMKYHWEHFLNVMGDPAVNISPAAMLRLIDSALDKAGDDIIREYDNEDNRQFRLYAMRRIDMMKQTLAARGIEPESCSMHDAMDAVCTDGLGQYATINYFLMRLVDKDLEAAEFLTDIPHDELMKSPLLDAGIQTLMRNSVTRLGRKASSSSADKLRRYSCRMTTLGSGGYYHITLTIGLDGSRTSRDATVKEISVGSITRLSSYEAAIQIGRPEYITVFSCHDEVLNGFDARHITPHSGVEQTACENGWLYTIYNQTNVHVEKSEYLLGDDVYGYALLTIGGELILMSHNLDRITMLDDSAVLSIYSPFIKVKGRYRLDSPVFHTLCHRQGVYFDDIVEPDE